MSVIKFKFNEPKLLKEIADSALEIVNPLRFKVVEYEDISFLSHLSEDEREAS